MIFVYLAIMIVSSWLVFTKAGRPGWASIIPIYNTYTLLKVASKPGWLLIGLFVPLVDLIIWILIYNGLAKNFGRGVGFTVGLIFLPFIFLPILALGSAEYIGTAKVQRTRPVVQRAHRRLVWWVSGIVVACCVIGLVIGFALTFSGTTGAQIGDMVWVDYTGTFDNGSIFDSSVNESFGHVAPLNFSIGAGQMIPGFEQAVIGMIVNESKTVHIPSEDAYGPKYFEVLLSELPADVQIGESLTNNILEVIVINISETTATLENTHPLAGENLTFSITLVQIGNSSK